MEYTDVYANFNSSFHYYLDMIANSKTEREQNFIQECINKGIDFNTCLYKKLIDDYNDLTINGRKVQLLPMGLRNSVINMTLINNDKHYYHRGSVCIYRGILLDKPKFVPFYYPDNDLEVVQLENLKKLCSSYIAHYQNTLGEIWSEKDFYTMFSSLKYLSVKYAKDTATGEIFAIGFFGANIRNGAGGLALTNAELYVMPEFRGLGIAKKMVGLTFDLAKNDGIENFDSITYRVPDNDALTFWQSIGASVSGLIHIEGNLSDMLNSIDKKTTVAR